MSYNKHNGDGNFSSLGKPSPLKGKVGNRKGMKNSAEHNAKNAAAHLGKPSPNKGRPSPFKGKPANRQFKPQSEEANRKRSEALKGRSATEEHRAKVAAAKLGKERPKVVCRLSDRKEMCLAHFNRYVK